MTRKGNFKKYRTKRPLFHSKKVHVMQDQCKTCIFRPGNLMHLEPGRLKDVVRENLDNDAALPCHHTVYVSDTDQLAVCRGFYDRYKDDVTALRLAQHGFAGVTIKEVDPYV